MIFLDCLNKICFVDFGRDGKNETNLEHLNYLLMSAINREYKEKTILTRLLGQILSASNFKLSFIAHVSSSPSNLVETMDILRLTSSIQTLIDQKDSKIVSKNFVY